MNIEVTGELENAIKTYAARQGLSADNVARRVLADVLMPPTKKTSSPRTGAAIVEAMQASPYKEIDLEPERFVMPVRNVDF